MKSPRPWQMPAWVSLPEQWLMTTWNKQTSTILAQNSVAVLSFEGQNTRALKRVVCKLLRFLLRRRFCRQNWYYVAQLNTSSISTYFLLPCLTLKKPERENLEVEQACRPASGPCKPVFWVFSACKQMKNRETKCAFIFVVVRPPVTQNERDVQVNCSWSGGFFIAIRL